MKLIPLQVIKHIGESKRWKYLGVKEKISGTKSSIKDQLGYLKKDSVFIKKILKSKNIIFLKTDVTAILVRRKGNEQEFFKEFDNITKGSTR